MPNRNSCAHRAESRDREVFAGLTSDCRLGFRYVAADSAIVDVKTTRKIVSDTMKAKRSAAAFTPCLAHALSLSVRGIREKHEYGRTLRVWSKMRNLDRKWQAWRIINRGFVELSPDYCQAFYISFILGDNVCPFFRICTSFISPKQKSFLKFGNYAGKWPTISGFTTCRGARIIGYAGGSPLMMGETTRDGFDGRAIRWDG